MLKKTLIIALCLLLFSLCDVSATDYYVNVTGGSDSSTTGNITNPYSTLAYASSICLNNCTIYLRQGWHNGSLDYRSLNLTGNITIAAYNGEEVNFSYTEPLSVWTNESNIWYSNVSYTSPDTNYFRAYLKDMSHKFFTYITNSSFRSCPYQYCVYTNTSYSPDRVFIKMNDTSLNPNTLGVNVSKMYLFDIRNTNSTITNSWIIIDDIHFKYISHVGILLSNTTNVIIQNCSFDGGYYPIQVDGKDNTLFSGTSIILRGNYWKGMNEFYWARTDETNNYESNEYITSDDYLGSFKIYNNTAKQGGGFDLLADSYNENNGTEIYNNTIYNSTGSVLEIESFCYNSSYHDNKILDTHYSGVSFAPANANLSPVPCKFYNNIIQSNHYYNETSITDIAAPFAIKAQSRVTGASNISNWDIYHNTFYSIGRAIYTLDAEATGNTNNTWTNVNWTNNIFYTVGNDTSLIYRTGLANAGVFFDYNIYYREGGSYLFQRWNNNTAGTYNTLALALASSDWDGTWDINSQEINPNFADVANFDFTPSGVACNMSSTGSYVGAVPCPDTTPPIVNLISPVNGTITNNINPLFTFNYTDSISNTSNCSINIYSDNNYCYQESANTTNQTGIDGNCGTNYNNEISVTNAEPYIYVNYTKPDIISFGAIWQVQGMGLTPTNYTIPSNCFEAYNNKIVLRIYSTVGATSYGQLQCHNSIDWDNVSLLYNDVLGSGSGGATNNYYWNDGNWTNLLGTAYMPAYPRWQDRTVYGSAMILEEAIYWALYGTIGNNASVINNTNTNIFSDSLVDGNYSAYVSCVDNSSNLGISGLVSFAIATNPYVSIINPSNGSNVSSNTLNISYELLGNSTDMDLSYFNISLLNIDGSFNQTLIGNNSNNLSYLYTGVLSGFSPGSYMLKVDAINSSGSIAASGNSTFSIVTDATLNITAINNSTGTSFGNFSINLTFLNLSTSIYQNSTDNYTLFGIFKNQSYSVMFISSTYNQTTTYNSNGSNTQNLVLNIIIPGFSVGTCAANTTAMFFDLKDEDTFSSLTGNFNYNFNITVGNTTYITYGNLSSSNNLSLCINASSEQTWTVNKGEIQYNSADHVSRRYYIFGGTRVTSTTTNITLYNLNNTLANAFQITATSSDLTPYTNNYVTLVRWYPELNQYNVVDMGLTDDLAQTVIYARTLDTDYRMGVYQTDGTLLYLADPIRMICLATPCTYDLISRGDSISYNALQNLQYSWDVNTTSGIWTFVYNDPSQETDTIVLTIYKETGDNEVTACTNNMSGYTGAVNCNVSGWSGSLKGVVTRFASPGVPIAQYLSNFTNSPFKSSIGLFLILILAIPIIFVLAFVSPIAALIGGVLSLIPALYLGSVSMTVVGAIAILAFIIVHFTRR